MAELSPGWSLWDTACCCSPPGCPTVTVIGCSNRGVPGSVVTVYDINTGATVDSGTTDGNGFLKLCAANGGVRYRITIQPPSTRFNFWQNTSFIFAQEQLTPANGYVCAPQSQTSGFPICVLPVATTLHLTWKTAIVFGGPIMTFTTNLTFVGGVWQGFIFVGLGFYFLQLDPSNWSLTGQNANAPFDSFTQNPTTFSCPPAFNWVGGSITITE